MALVSSQVPRINLPRLPKLRLPIKIKIRPKNEISIAEKFRLLCPLWYNALTTKHHLQRLMIKTENKLSYTNPVRCVMGEAYGFNINNYWWTKCNTCDIIGNGFCDLTHKICISNWSLNRSRQVKKFINHMEKCHPDVIDNKWDIKY